MSGLIKSTILALIMSYAVTAFVLFELSPYVWSEDSRAGCILLWMCGSGVFGLIQSEIRR